MARPSTSTPAPNTPVIIGVGQFLNRDDDDPIDPVALATVAARLAADDCGTTAVLQQLDLELQFLITRSPIPEPDKFDEARAQLRARYSLP